ncbi:TRP-domain-containing protein, partial [Aspergillus heteromorphus CBS 117.55]
MKLSWVLIKLGFILFMTALTQATYLIQSNALSFCQDKSNLTISYFSMTFTPNNRSVSISFDGTTEISGNVTAEISLFVYGYKALSTTLDPCESGYKAFCPMSAGSINLAHTSIILSGSTVSQIPSIGYLVPDLDITVRVYVSSTKTGEVISCVEGALSNGKTVYQQGVGWTTAILAGLGLLASGVASARGHSASTTRLAAATLPLLGFMQTQASFGMVAVHMPPIVESWTQNFQWTMGIIYVGSVETICTWYQRATGGTPSTTLSDLSRWKKRSIAGAFARRASESSISSIATVRGIERVGFQANIERTNIFLTTISFFAFFVFAVFLLLAIFRAYYESVAIRRKLRRDIVSAYRRDWRVLVKRNVLRLLSLGFFPVCILCPWEMQQQDSSAEIILAVLVFLFMLGMLGSAAVGFVLLTKEQSSLSRRRVAYIFSSNPFYSSDWVFLFMSTWRAASFFVAADLAYLLCKGMVIGLSQPTAVAQAVFLLILEVVQIIVLCRLRPWSDKKLKRFSITLATIRMVDAIFLLVFTGVFSQPAMMTSIMGVIYVLYNAIMAIILLLNLLIASWHAMRSKDGPSTR